MLQSMGSQSRTRLSDWTQSSHIVVCICVCMSIPISQFISPSHLPPLLSLLVTIVLCSVSQPCLTLCDPTDCSPSGSSVHGIFLARLLEWVDIYSSRGSSWPKNQTGIFCVSCIGRWILFHWATGKLLLTIRLFSMSVHLFLFCK